MHVDASQSTPAEHPLQGPPNSGNLKAELPRASSNFADPQRPIQQVLGSNPEPQTQACPNCGGDHLLSKCTGPVDEWGYIWGCGRCNEMQHTLAECKMRVKKSDLRHFIFRLRKDKPPMVWDTDLRDPTLSEYLDECQPWTAEFSLAQSRRGTEAKVVGPIPDPAWQLAFPRIPPQIHPGFPAALRGKRNSELFTKVAQHSASAAHQQSVPRSHVPSDNQMARSKRSPTPEQLDALQVLALTTTLVDEKKRLREIVDTDEHRDRKRRRNDDSDRRNGNRRRSTSSPRKMGTKDSERNARNASHYSRGRSQRRSRSGTSLAQGPTSSDHSIPERSRSAHRRDTGKDYRSRGRGESSSGQRAKIVPHGTTGIRIGNLVVTGAAQTVMGTTIVRTATTLVVYAGAEVTPETSVLTSVADNSAFFPSGSMYVNSECPKATCF